MANITSYKETESLASNDLFIISDASEANSTKSVKLSTLSDYIGSNLVLKSPNGTDYEITVSDAGVITATAV